MTRNVFLYGGSEETKTTILLVEPESRVDIIIGSTEDFGEFVNEMVRLPNPIDTEHFTYENDKSIEAFMIRRSVMSQGYPAT